MNLIWRHQNNVKNFLLFFLAFPVTLACVATSGSYQAKADDNKIAIDGYDTVAYFTLHKATKGNDRFQHNWNGRTWYFSSANHRDLFKANPHEYAPQFNGLCANGLSDGHAVDANPDNWKIIDSKLYLFFSERGRDKWVGNVKSLLHNAQETYENH